MNLAHLSLGRFREGCFPLHKTKGFLLFFFFWYLSPLCLPQFPLSGVVCENGKKLKNEKLVSMLLTASLSL